MQIGAIHSGYNLNFLKSWKSKIFTIASVYSIENIKYYSSDDGYLDVKFDRDTIADIVSCPVDCDIAVGIMPYRFKDNFYMHRVAPNVAVVSLYGIFEILSRRDISIDYFVLKQIYEICAIRHLMKDISNDFVFDIIHRDTRGCLFDMNGDREDILYNTEQPIVCDACKAYFKKKQVDPSFVTELEKELKRLRKPVIVRVESWIKQYPFVSLSLSFLSALIVNLLSSFLVECIKR